MDELETVPEGEEAAPPPAAGAGAGGTPPASAAAQPTSAGDEADGQALGSDGGRVKSTPLARKIAKEHGLDVTSIKGTGPGGRVTREDVEAALAAAPQTSAPPAPAAACGPGETPVLRRVAYSGMRKAIGTAMSASWNAVPRVTQHAAIDIHALIALREQINEGRDKEQRLSLTDLLVKITATALILMPDLNGVFDGQELRIMSDVNMGVAMAVGE